MSHNYNTIAGGIAESRFSNIPRPVNISQFVQGFLLPKVRSE